MISVDGGKTYRSKERVGIDFLGTVKLISGSLYYAYHYEDRHKKWPWSPAEITWKRLEAKHFVPQEEIIRAH
jgi:hypothetical protein